MVRRCWSEARDSKLTKSTKQQGTSAQRKCGDEFKKMWIKLSNDIKEVAMKCEPYFFSSVCDEVDKLKNDILGQGEIYKAQECLKELKVKKY